MIRSQFLSGHKGIALDTAPTAQGNAEDCEKRRLHSTEVAAKFQGTDVFGRLLRAFGWIGWSLYSLDSGAVVASSAMQYPLLVCPDSRAASALLRKLGG
jgi:hypothetical protein